MKRLLRPALDIPHLGLPAFRLRILVRGVFLLLALATVALSIGGNTRAATVSGTSWSYALQSSDITAMGQGTEILSATQTDAAGNKSAAGTRTITVDSMTPEYTTSDGGGTVFTEPASTEPHLSGPVNDVQVMDTQDTPTLDDPSDDALFIANTATTPKTRAETATAIIIIPRMDFANFESVALFSVDSVDMFTSVGTPKRYALWLTGE